MSPKLEKAIKEKPPLNIPNASLTAPAGPTNATPTLTAPAGTLTAPAGLLTAPAGSLTAPAGPTSATPTMTAAAGPMSAIPTTTAAAGPTSATPTTMTASAGIKTDKDDSEKAETPWHMRIPLQQYDMTMVQQGPRAMVVKRTSITPRSNTKGTQGCPDYVDMTDYKAMKFYKMPDIGAGFWVRNLYTARILEPCEACIYQNRILGEDNDHQPCPLDCTCRRIKPDDFQGQLIYNYKGSWRAYHHTPPYGAMWSKQMIPLSDRDIQIMIDEQGGKCRVRPRHALHRDPTKNCPSIWTMKDWENLVHKPLREAAKQFDQERIALLANLLRHYPLSASLGHATLQILRDFNIASTRQQFNVKAAESAYLDKSITITLSKHQEDARKCVANIQRTRLISKLKAINRRQPDYDNTLEPESTNAEAEDALMDAKAQLSKSAATVHLVEQKRVADEERAASRPTKTQVKRKALAQPRREKKTKLKVKSRNCEKRDTHPIGIKAELINDENDQPDSTSEETQGIKRNQQGHQGTTHSSDRDHDSTSRSQRETSP